MISTYIMISTLLKSLANTLGVEAIALQDQDLYKFGLAFKRKFGFRQRYKIVWVHREAETI